MKSTSRILHAVVVLAMVILISACGAKTQNAVNTANEPSKTNQQTTENKKASSSKKVLYIDSYHEGYAWSDGITKGIKDALEPKGISVKVFRMDTKRNNTEEFKKKSALEAKAEIESYKPDLVIVSDDNAVKYILQEYYKDSNIPFVFNGLNWDASGYGLPYKNTTGMVEVSLTNQMIQIMKEYKNGTKVGYLSANTETEKKNAQYYRQLLNINMAAERYASTLEQWKQMYKSMQDDVDMLIIENNAGIENWNDAEAAAFVKENKKVLSCSPNDWMTKFVDIVIAKSAVEQGRYSAEVAVKIFEGAAPNSIPIVENKEGELFLNVDLANKINVVFKPEILKNAKIVK